MFKHLKDPFSAATLPNCTSSESGRHYAALVPAHFKQNPYAQLSAGADPEETQFPVDYSRPATADDSPINKRLLALLTSFTH